MICCMSSNICSTVVTNSSDFLMTLFWVIDGFCPSFLVDHPFVFSLCWMLYFFCPCFLINNPLLLCNSWMVYCLVNCFLVNNPLVLSLCWVFNGLRPSRRVHNPDKAVTNRCFLYRNKRGKVRIISRNNADTA